MSEVGGSNEDAKLVVLARGAMARSGATTGAAIRDIEGRCYSAGGVTLRALRLTALQAAVAAAVSSGARGFEAAVLVGACDDADPGIAVIYEVSPSARIIVAHPPTFAGGGARG